MLEEDHRLKKPLHEIDIKQFEHLEKHLAARGHGMGVQAGGLMWVLFGLGAVSGSLAGGAAAELAELDIAPVEPEAGGRLFHQLYSVLIQILSRDLVVLVQMVHIPVAVVVVDCKFPYFRM